MKTIFVTGGAGYIGSICVEQLLNEGYEVAVFDNLTEGHRKAVNPKAEFFQGDLADRTVISRAMSEVSRTQSCTSPPTPSSASRCKILRNAFATMWPTASTFSTLLSRAV